MSFITRLGVFVAIATAGVIAWQWNVALDSSRDVTHLAVQQFHNNNAVPANLQEASLAQNWWPLLWPALLVVVACVLFWDDVERWWKHDEIQ